jgi:hypothetical protein
MTCFRCVEGIFVKGSSVMSLELLVLSDGGEVARGAGAALGVFKAKE